MSVNRDDGWVLVRVVTVVGNGCTTAAGDRVDSALMTTDRGFGDGAMDTMAAPVAADVESWSWEAADAGTDMLVGCVHQKSRGSATGTAAGAVPLAARKRAIMVPMVDGGTAGPASVGAGAGAGAVTGAGTEAVVVVDASTGASLVAVSVVVVKYGRVLSIHNQNILAQR